MILALVIISISILVGIYDWVRIRNKFPRAFLLEFFGFVLVLLFALKEDWFNQLAHAFGVGRGVDFVIYPTMLWLCREAVHSRIRSQQQQQEITKMVRHMAVIEAQSVKGKG